MIGFCFLSVVNFFPWNYRAPLQQFRFLLSVLGGSVATLSAGNSACKLGKLEFYAGFICVFPFPVANIAAPSWEGISSGLVGGPGAVSR